MVLTRLFLTCPGYASRVWRRPILSVGVPRIILVRTNSSSPPGDMATGTLIAIPEIQSFIERCMTKVGTKPAHATALAENLTAADHRGHFSHGLNRLGK